MFQTVALLNCGKNWENEILQKLKRFGIQSFAKHGTILFSFMFLPKMFTSVLP